MKSITLILMATLLVPQEHQKEEKLIGKLVTVHNKLTVVVDNIFGEIQVTKSTTNELRYAVHKKVSASNDETLAKGWSEINLKVIERNDSIIFHLTAPYICDQWSSCKNEDRWIRRHKNDYDFSFDFMLEVPQYANLDAQTIDGGEVVVTDIAGTLNVHNVNGGIMIRGAQAVASACTVNGDVEIYFNDKPSRDATFRTINGSINLYSQTSLNARVKAKSMNGSLFSAFEYRSLAPTLEKFTAKNGQSTVYKINESIAIEIGNNGPELNFETLNGNIYLRKF